MDWKRHHVTQARVVTLPDFSIGGVKMAEKPIEKQPSDFTVVRQALSFVLDSVHSLDISQVRNTFMNKPISHTGSNSRQNVVLEKDVWRILF